MGGVAAVKQVAIKAKRMVNQGSDREARMAGCQKNKTHVQKIKAKLMLNGSVEVAGGCHNSKKNADSETLAEVGEIFPR